MVEAIFNIILSAIQGVFTFVWGVVESLGSFVGASAHFVACESSPLCPWQAPVVAWLRA